MGTTEENKQNPTTPPSKTPQLHAPRPKEMQRILQEHHQQMHTIEKDKKEMEEEKEKQRLAEEQKKSTPVEERVQTGQSSAPPPSPAVALSPIGSTGVLDETRPTSGTSRRGSNAAGPSTDNLNTSGPSDASSNNNVVEKNHEVTKETGQPKEKVLEESNSESVAESPGPVSQEDKSRARPSSVKSTPDSTKKSTTLFPREGASVKRSSSAKD